MVNNHPGERTVPEFISNFRHTHSFGLKLKAKQFYLANLPVTLAVSFGPFGIVCQVYKVKTVHMQEWGNLDYGEILLLFFPKSLFV